MVGFEELFYLFLKFGFRLVYVISFAYQHRTFAAHPVEPDIELSAGISKKQ